MAPGPARLSNYLTAVTSEGVAGPSDLSTTLVLQGENTMPEPPSSCHFNPCMSEQRIEVTTLTPWFLRRLNAVFGLLCLLTVLGVRCNPDSEGGGGREEDPMATMA